jgi:hypothetical protein
MTAESDEAWMVWLTSAETASVIDWNRPDLLEKPSQASAKAHSDFEAWIDALMVGREG